MANNQIEFNNEYNKETKEIKIETEDFAEEQLIIKDYPNLEKLYLYDIQEIGKITLKSLPQLQECTIWDCSLKELVIENCPQIKVLNVRQNNLANLEFLKGLGNLETLEIDGNPELIKMLEPYRKIIQKSNENVQTLEEEKKFLFAQLDTSQQKYENLKNFLKEILVSLSKDNQEELVNELNSEIENRKKNAPSFYSTEIKTTELTSSLRLSVEEIKELRGELEIKLTESKAKIWTLEKELVAAKARAEARQGKIQKLSESVAQTPIYKKNHWFFKNQVSFS